MPIPVGAIGAISGAVGQIQQTRSNLMNFGLTEWSNKRNRDWQEMMYDRQYQDNLRLWELQNEYNTPANQMARYSAAGLNKNLIYGQTNEAGSISAPNAGDVDYQAYQLQNNQPSILDQFAQIQQVENQEAQGDLIKAQADVQRAEAAYKGELANKTRYDTLRGGIEAYKGWKTYKNYITRDNLKTDFEMSNLGYSLEASREQARKLKQENDIAIREDARRAALSSASLEETVEKIMTMRAERSLTPEKRSKYQEDVKLSQQQRQKIQVEMENLKRDIRLKDIDTKLQENHGISSKDPAYYKIIAKVAEEIVKRMIER